MSTAYTSTSSNQSFKNTSTDGSALEFSNSPGKSIDELIKTVKSGQYKEIINLMLSRKISAHKLESLLGREHAKLCVDIRRQYVIQKQELDQSEQQQRRREDDETVHKIPTDSSNYDNKHMQSNLDALRQPQDVEFDYSRVVNQCCENVIGFVRLPVGLAGPLLLDDQSYFVPMATTEGCLVASTSRGLSALFKSGGVFSRIHKDAMTRAPIIKFNGQLRDALKNVERAVEWLSDDANKEKIIAAFRSTSQHITHVDYTVHTLARQIHIRFEAQTGDAMGMNMCSKGAEMALREMKRHFPTMDVLTLSGNMCTDKKPSAINMILGRGKSVECSASLPEEVVEKVLKVPVDRLYEVWLKKNMAGSAMAGSVGGFNSHAANIVAAIFLATGQDAAQVVSSSNCIIFMEKKESGLEVHCKMPSIECGTVGGGTVLKDQNNYLHLMGIEGPTELSTLRQQGTRNACKFAKIICATVMAAELSLLASLTEGTLVKSHMTHNRSAQPCNVV